ncbi:glycosyltransferase family 32 protein [Fictibacillus arsenicus]|uniref:glycosyltransferase family 32 protein n=1 Tax=Fictibacillus arsenicus TaxID=255247 RepID=UPI0026A3EB26
MNQKIEKKIHYCWFGKQKKPNIVIRCLESWGKYLTEYEIIEWNENNFDINCNTYVKEAYEQGKFAFVSDFVRVYALYHYGGVYLDTDVEVFKNFNDLLHHDSFWGFEQENYVATSTIGAAKGNKLIKIFLDSYSNRPFIKKDGSFDEMTNVTTITNLLKEQGLVQNGKYQVIQNLGTFYPQTYFSPFDYINCRKRITNNTYAMHHFYKSWLSPKAKAKSNLKNGLAKVIGGNGIAFLRKLKG